MARRPSPFLHLGSETQANSLAIIHLSRDRLEPIYLQETNGEHDGYAEGVVLNTRFGSFPHSTFINVPWGSQIRASEVDTGSRGKKQKKRRRGPEDEAAQDEAGTPGTGAEGAENNTDQGGASEGARKGAKKAVAASSGFVHILAPSPELWTMSLPHRTQVVYTPDYSYILQRIRARPGSRLIEAGAGSGSFTHASARAVYNGVAASSESGACRGKVFSFEFDETRYGKMCSEITAHQLDDVVQITHRDVYKDGFLVDGKSPGADAVFLDLPAPWEALPHLARRKFKEADEAGGPTDEKPGTRVAAAPKQVMDESFVSPLNPKKSVYLCTFSPCIEQVSRTVSTMRRLGWMDIETVEIANKRIHVLREKVGLTVATDRGMAQLPADVGEAVDRLRRIEERVREHQRAMHDPEIEDVEEYLRANFDEPLEEASAEAETGSGKEVPPFMQGRLVTRPETELRTHTSYLTFAILPREWTAEDEAAALEKWPCGQEKAVIGSLDKEARKQQKREMLQPKKKKKAGSAADQSKLDTSTSGQADGHIKTEGLADDATVGEVGEDVQPKRKRDDALGVQGNDAQADAEVSKRIKVEPPQQS